MKLFLPIFGLALSVATSASALTFNFRDTGGAAVGTNAYYGFSAAGAFWSSVLKDDVTVNIDIGFKPLGAGVLGSTGSNLFAVSASSVLNQMRLDSTSALDAKAVTNLPVLSAAGGLNVITSGYNNTTTKSGVNAATRVYDTDDSSNNTTLAITTANAKALGYTGFTGADAQITFSSNFNFDFNPADSIGANSYDFIGIATHELGHALGFISGVDTYDYYAGPKGPARTSTLNLNNYAVGSTLDLFRYTKDPLNLVPGTTPALDWSIGGSPYFSVDGGKTAVSLGSGTGAFSTGAYNGNKRQASHWVDNSYSPFTGGCDPLKAPSVSRGLMDPTAGRCEAMSVTALDLAAFDAIGWDLAAAAKDNAKARYTTAYISTLATPPNSAVVPEPASWAMLIMGFGLTGAAMRRRRPVAA